MNRFCLLLDRKDVNRPENLIALDMFRVFAGYSIRPNKITFGKAQELDQRPDLPCDENSFCPVTIDRSEDTRFVGETGFMYRRWTLAEVARDQIVKINGTSGQFKVEDIIDQINEQLETQFTLESLDNSVVYDTDGDEFVLYAHPNSLAFCGSVAFELGDPERRDLLSVTDLTGFLPSPTFSYAGTSIQRLVAMITADNPTLASYVYGVDYQLSGLTGIPFDPEGRNTAITFIPTSNKFNIQTLRYRRLTASALNPDPLAYSPLVLPTFPSSTHQVLDRINAILGTNLRPSEVENTIYARVADEFALTFTNTSQSHAWLSGTYYLRGGFAGNFRFSSTGRYRVTGDGQLRSVTLPQG